jgi:hypothetical protein
MSRVRPVKPQTFNGDLSNLPAALAAWTHEPRWLIWSWEWTGTQWSKPPRQARDPSLYAKTDDPQTWGSYTDALMAVQSGQAEGLGYVLSHSDVAAADLDHCHDVNSGKIDTWAQKEIEVANGCYCEITPSGAGLRIIGIGAGEKIDRKWKVPGTANGAQIEAYRATNKYITVTGAQIAGGAELCGIDDVLDNIVKRYDTKAETKAKAANGKTTARHSCSADIEDIIKHGVPRPGRSEAFSKVVWSLAGKGYGHDEIHAILAQYPNGIAEKYINRLEKEVSRCYGKWRLANPKVAAPNGGVLGWPDRNTDGTPKRTYRNARLAIEGLGVICSYDTFHDRMLIEGNNETHAINQWHGEVTDAAIMALRQLIIDVYGFTPGRTTSMMRRAPCASSIASIRLSTTSTASTGMKRRASTTG